MSGPGYLDQAPLEEKELARSIQKELSVRAKAVKTFDSEKRKLNKRLKETQEQLDVAKLVLKKTMEENALIEFVSRDGIRVSIKSHARGKITDWQSLWRQLEERGELGMVKVKFSGRLRDVVTEYIREHDEEIDEDDLELSCPWNTLESWLKEVADEQEVALLDLSIEGLEIDSWEEVKVK